MSGYSTTASESAVDAEQKLASAQAKYRETKLAYEASKAKAA